jgi:hypothetical protein
MRYIELMEGPERVAQLTKMHGEAVAKVWWLRDYDGDEPLPDSEMLAIKGAEFIARMAEYDPTPGKKYLNWLIRCYLQSVSFKFEDLAKFSEQLELFDKLVKSKRIEKRDINQYKTPNDLYKAVEPFMVGELAINSDDERARKFRSDPHATVLCDGDTLVVVPKTFEASRYWGSNTNWCTVADERYFHQYSGRGPLYIIWVKSSNQRYQFHFDTRQFLNTSDEPFSVDEWHTISADALAAIAKHENLSSKAFGELLHGAVRGTLSARLVKAIIDHSEDTTRARLTLMDLDRTNIGEETHEFARDFVLDCCEYLTTRNLLDVLSRTTFMRAPVERLLVDYLNAALENRDLKESGDQIDLTAPLTERNMKRLAEAVNFEHLNYAVIHQIIDSPRYEWLYDRVIENASPEMLMTSACSHLGNACGHFGNSLRSPEHPVFVQRAAQARKTFPKAANRLPSPQPVRSYEKKGHKIAEYAFRTNRWGGADQSIMLLIGYLVKRAKQVIETSPPKVLKISAMHSNVAFEKALIGRMVTVGDDALLELKCIETGSGDLYSIYANGDFVHHDESLYRTEFQGRFKFMAARLEKLDMGEHDDYDY